MINRETSSVYQAGVATKILQLMDRIRNVSDLSQSRRWVMELLQNARDISYEDQLVRVRIEYTPEHLRFYHNGKPFRVRDILSIINQVSSKDGSGNTVGHFGTGFMSTYQLSERVEVCSVLKDRDPVTGAELPYRPFRIVLDRSGRTNEDILSAIQDSVNQLNAQNVRNENDVFDPQALNTCFSYMLDTEERRTCARIGVQDLKNTILFVLLFSDKLAEIEILIDDEVTIYRRGSTERVSAHIQALSVIELHGNQITEHKVMYFRDQDLTMAAHVDHNGVILPLHPDTPRVFVDFPLIGAEQFPFPVVLNSRNFKPNEPRSGITLVDNAQSSDAKCNKALMERAVVNYKLFLHELVEQKIAGISNVIAIPAFMSNKEISETWIKEQVYTRLYDTIIHESFIPTQLGDSCLADPALYLVDGADDEECERVKSLLGSLKNFQFSNGKEPWIHALSGYEVPKEKIVDLKKLLDCAQQLLMQNLDESRCTAMEWCSQLYSAAMQNMELAVLIASGQIKIFPNQSQQDWKERKLFAVHELKRDPGIPSILKDVSELLDQLESSRYESPIYLRKNLLALEFQPQNIPKMEEYEKARLHTYISQRSSRRYPVSNMSYNRNKYEKLWLRAWKLMLSCSSDKNLYDLYARIPQSDFPEKVTMDYSCDEGMWRNSFSGLTSIMLDIIEEKKTLQTLQEYLKFENLDQTIQWMNSVFLYAVQYTDTLTNRHVFPNQNGTFISCLSQLLGNKLISAVRDGTKEKELKQIAQLFSDKDPACRYPEYVLDCRLGDAVNVGNTLTDDMVASKISNMIATLLQEKSLSEASENHQRACSMLMTWLQSAKNEEQAKKLFPMFAAEEERMKLLTPGEAVKLSQRSEQLQKIMDISDVENTEDLIKCLAEMKQLMDDTGCGNLEELRNKLNPKQEEVSQRNKETRECGFFHPQWDCYIGDDFDYNRVSQDDFNDFCRKVGLAGERYVFLALKEEYIGKGYIVRLDISGEIRLQSADGNSQVRVEYPDHNGHHQAGWDIRVTEHTPNGERVRYIEVKTHTERSIARDRVDLSRLQMQMALSCMEEYSIAKVTYCVSSDSCTLLEWYSDLPRCVQKNQLVCQNDKYYFAVQ